MGGDQLLIIDSDDPNSSRIYPPQNVSGMAAPLVSIVGPGQLLIVDQDRPTSPIMWPPPNVRSTFCKPYFVLPLDLFQLTS